MRLGLWRESLEPHGAVPVLNVNPPALLALVNRHRGMDQGARNDSVRQIFVTHRTVVAEVICQPLALCARKSRCHEARDVSADRLE